MKQPSKMLTILTSNPRDQRTFRHVRIVLPHPISHSGLPIWA